ncbi:MAG: GntR family transcriptional regulator [Parvibaculum sp.]
MLQGITKQASQTSELGEEAIVDRIFEAVIDQRLPPGTKLSESALCEAFAVGRMRVRRSLLLLASRHIVDLHSNRGAYVASPTPDQAREVFEARRAIEPNVARIVAERAEPADIDGLGTHLTQESAAQQEGDRRNAIRLSGQFHVKLAELARNHVLERMVKELVTRTSLILGMFGAPGTSNCHDDEHLQILSALIERDQVSAARLMHQHLEHIERQIDLAAEPRRSVDLVEVFRAR